MKTKMTWLLSLLLVTVAAQAHHSFAPHFDSSKPVNLTGVVTEFEQRNPHAYLHIRVTDADGRTADWRCESHGVTQLTRNGITPDLLKPGTELRISGSQHRRDPHECFFDTVYLPDGRSLSVNGPRGAEAAAPQVAQRDSMYGVWLLMPANRPTSGPQFMMDYLTDAAKAAVAKYDPFTMDPTYRCEPVAIRRGWFAPGTPMAIRKDGSNIIIQHEWMDIKRVVHMNEKAAPANTKETILGYSRGHFDGDTLVVETDHYAPGVLNQFVEVKGQPMRGQLHSNALRTVERISFDKPGNRIKLVIETYDPVFFTRDFPPSDAEFAASDLDIKPFGCIPEQLK
ncbi:MAG TPA: DUF6152 family protein [Candidatus Acidoferrum sp.]|nr:DUF6152 family protein [Candidatus Acidoferrum sp.]